MATLPEEATAEVEVAGPSAPRGAQQLQRFHHNSDPRSHRHNHRGTADLQKSSAHRAYTAQAHTHSKLRRSWYQPSPQCKCKHTMQAGRHTSRHVGMALRHTRPTLPRNFLLRNPSRCCTGTSICLLRHVRRSRTRRNGHRGGTVQSCTHRHRPHMHLHRTQPHRHTSIRLLLSES